MSVLHMPLSMLLRGERFIASVTSVPTSGRRVIGHDGWPIASVTAHWADGSHWRIFRFPLSFFYVVSLFFRYYMIYVLFFSHFFLIIFVDCLILLFYL